MGDQRERQNATPRQEALLQLWDTSGPADVLVVVARYRAARDAGLIQELREEAHAAEPTNRVLAIRLSNIADALSQVHEAVRQFSTSQDFNELATLLERYELAWSTHFLRALGAFWRDSLASANEKLAQGLRNGFRLYQRARRGFLLLSRLPALHGRDIFEFVRGEPILCDPAFRRLLVGRARFATQVGDAGAADIQRMNAYLADICQRIEVVAELEKAGARAEHPVRVRMPLPPELAELWFAQHPQFAEEASALARAVAEGRVSLDVAADQAADLCRVLGPDTFPARAYARAAFLEFVLRTGFPLLTEPALIHYSGVATAHEWAAQDPELWATWILRYSKAVAVHWREVREPPSILAMSADLISRALPGLDERTSPRLIRDLLFTRARINESLGIWQPERYREAERDYTAGLAIRAVAHEGEARARALADLANTVERLSRRDDKEADRRIVALYEEALSLLTPEHPISRSSILISLAAHYHERVLGDPAANVERALAAASDAIQSLETTADLAWPDPAHLRSLSGAAFLTLGNMIRERSYGDSEERLRLAREAYLSGLGSMKQTKNDQLEGIIRLNLGHVCIDLYRSTGEHGYLRDAFYNYTESAVLLAQYPKELAHSLLNVASLELEADPGQEDLDQGLDKVQQAAAIGEARGDAVTLGRCHHLWGRLLVARSRSHGLGDLEAAASHFVTAMTLFVESGSVYNSVIAARSAADAHVRVSVAASTNASLQEASRILRQAVRSLEDMWSRFDSVEWRYTLSLELGEIYADLAWCQAAAGLPSAEVLRSAGQAQGREYVEHMAALRRRGRGVGDDVADYLERLRVQARLVEIQQWFAQREAGADQSLHQTLSRSSSELDELRTKARLVAGDIAREDGDAVRAIQSYLATCPEALVWIITVSRWGALSIVASSGGQAGDVSLRIVQLPFTRGNLYSLLYGTEDEIGWWLAYHDYTSAAPHAKQQARRRWARTTETMQETLTEALLRPTFETAGKELASRLLVVVPGALSGMPLHGLRVAADGRLLFEVCTGFAYAASVLGLPSTQRSWWPPKTAICVLSDPSHREQDQLPEALREVTEAAATLIQYGSRVVIAACVGADVGMAVFDKHRVSAPPASEVLDVRPSPEFMKAQMPRFDHVFYVGHGVRQLDGRTGLILIDEAGKPQLFSGEDILTLGELRQAPVIYLSACEGAAQEAIGGSEVFSFASCLLRAGAAFVIANLWAVSDRVARVFAREWYACLADTPDPARAYCVALSRTRKALPSVAAAGLEPPIDHPVWWSCFAPWLGG